MPEIHEARRRRAQEKIAEVGADAALITSRQNITYLTGLASSNAAVLIPADGAVVLATDSRYALAAERDCPELGLVTGRFVEARLATEATVRGMRVVSFEAHEMTVERHAELAKTLTLVAFGHAIEELRMVKDPTELELIDTASRTNEQGLADTL